MPCSRMQHKGGMGEESPLNYIQVYKIEKQGFGL